jgi:hypothetical protein
MQLPGKEILHKLLSALLLLVLSLSCWFTLQNEPWYNHTLGLIAGNYKNQEGVITKSKIPYEKFESSKLLHWDAALYRQIRDNGYDMKSAGGDYIFAFFPLFPMLWRVTALSPAAISLLQYLFWIVSVILLFRLLPTEKRASGSKLFIITSGIPMLMVFLIPYSEGLFMITFTLALWGLYHNKYFLYFLAALLAAMTRSSVTILLLSFLFTEVYFYIQKNCLAATLKSLILKTAPLILGTLLVSLIQFTYGSNHIAKFMEVEKYWGYSLRLPSTITDWAHEQFSTNLPLLLIVLPAILIFLTFMVLKQLKARKNPSSTVTPSAIYNREYLYILSLVYIAGMILALLLLRGGSLNGLSRYIFCTPFYVLALFMVGDKTVRYSLKTRMIFFFTALLLQIIALSVVSYSKHWNFSDLGFIIFNLQIAFFLFDPLLKNKLAVAAFILTTSLWTSYLLNMFISNAWIVT